MLKLIRLEWHKNNINKYIRNAVILALAMVAFLFAFAFLGIARDPDTGVPDVALGNNSMAIPIEMFTSIAFLIFTSVMLSSFIVSAYKNKTMNLMFSYPIKRQKILLSQMLSVWIFCFIALVLTKVFIYGCIMAGAQFMKSDFPIDFDMRILPFYIQLILKSIVTVSVSFIALFVGMAMKSSKATIIASFLLIFLLQGSIGDFSLSGNIVFPIILIMVSLLCVLLSLRNVETKDLL